jgi:hypothetical protein
MSRAVFKWAPRHGPADLAPELAAHCGCHQKELSRDRGLKNADFENDDDDDDSDQYEVPGDLAASHTNKTAENYGVTIDVLKRLTAESLEIFGQVSYRWHKFLGLIEQPSSQPSLKTKCMDVGGLTPRKRPKILPLNKAVSEVASEQALLKALRAVLRDDHAQFRTPSEGGGAAGCSEGDPTSCDPTNGRLESLVFMVPAMLSSSGVTIVVAPYAELKRQLVTRCIDAGLDCKHWPEARKSWPRVVLVSAEAASSDDFTMGSRCGCPREARPGGD